MKKILLIISLAFLVNSYTLADETVNSKSLVNSTSLPTDEEIMETIQKFNFDKTQEEYLFKETKKTLEKMQEDGSLDASKLQEELNSVSDSLPEITKTDGSIEMDEPTVKSTTKKYTNHSPLTRRSSQ